MGKVNNALKLLAILRSRGKVTRKELAEELEVNIREITRYKEDLEATGVFIREIRGRYGGYVLENKDYLLNLELSKLEELALIRANEFLKGQGLHYLKDFSSAVDKIKASNPRSNDYDSQNYYSKGIKVKSNHEEESRKWLIINDGIINSRKIKISYKDAEGNVTERIVDPYGLYTYYGANFFIGKCNTKDTFRNFKLVRIKEISILNEKFDKEQFNIKDYLKDNLGVFKDEKYNLRLKISYPYAQAFKEFQWVEDEVIEDYPDEKYIIYKATMEGETQIVSWIMGMGESCEVLEPKEIKNAVIKSYKKVLNNYINKDTTE